MELYEAIERRHSVRAFRPDPVSREDLDRLVAAAALAPSAMNEQPWRFLITTGETRARVGEIMAGGTIHLQEYVEVLGVENLEQAVEWYSSLGHAPVLIVCTTPEPSDDLSRLNTYLSIGAALQNILLATTALGLAACNITFSFYVRDEMAQELGIEPDREIVALIAVGYPADEQPGSPPRASDVAVYLD